MLWMVHSTITLTLPIGGVQRNWMQYTGMVSQTGRNQTGIFKGAVQKRGGKFVRCIKN